MTKQSVFQDQTILITGGTGSFGRALTRHLLKENACKKVIIFSRDEWKQWEMRRSDPLFDDPKIRYFLGDVRDQRRLSRAFEGVDMIVHAAALKQVPAAEYNPTEFIRTNVDGAINVIDVAIDRGVKKVIALSTDKAVNPVNLYGATKLCSDKLFVAGNVYVGAKGHPALSVVRYGNVAGSRGSIIPYWQQLIEQGIGALPVTDDRMTRFWITLEQSVDFVCKCFGQMKRGGEIFVPKIPSVRIMDLAEALAPKLTKEICGIRPGEKLHELMISTDDARHTIEYKDHYVILPELARDEVIPDDHPEKIRGKRVADDFIYASNTNTKWLNVEEIKHFLERYQEIL